jgi:hypothetical protein
MTSTSNESAEGQLRHARDTAMRIVSAMLDGSGLHIRELDHELVITNPHDPDRGQVRVAFADGYVSWERVTWAYWGHLEGFDDADPKVDADKIISALAPR